MSNIFGMFNTATRGMQVQSLMIATASHNISNAETVGYSRQRVRLQASMPYTLSGIGQLGTGVESESIRRLRDKYLDVQVRYETSNLSKYNSSQVVLDQIETIFKEPSDSSLSKVMASMWSSWSELTGGAEGTTNRTVVVQRTADFAQTLNHMSNQLDAIKTNTIEDIGAQVSATNSILNQIRDVVDQIYKVKIQGIEPNDLLDRRDALLDQLSEFVNIDVQEDEFGRVRIVELDSGTRSELLAYRKSQAPEWEMSSIRSAEYDAVGGVWTLQVVKKGDVANVQEILVSGHSTLFKDGDVLLVRPDDWVGGTLLDFQVYRPKTGGIAGAQTAIDKLNGYQEDLDKLAYGIARSVNTIHSGSGAPSIFVDDNGNEIIPGDYKGFAKKISVNQVIKNDVSLIEVRGDSLSMVGDTNRANAISKLSLTSLLLYDVNQLDGQLAGYNDVDLKIANAPSGSTTDGYYAGLIGKVGIDSAASKRGIENQEVLLLQLREKQQATSGVSIDEEVTNLIQFQTAYQANARVINTLSMVLDTLINLGR